MKTKVAKVVANVGRTVSNKSPLIFTGLAVAGVVLTVYSVYKAAPKVQDILEDKKEDLELCGPEDKEAKNQVKREAVKEIVPIVIKPVATGTATIAFILLAHRASSKQLAAAVAAYDISRTAYMELKDKTKEVVGEKKASLIQEEVAKEHFNKAKEKNIKPIETGKGNVLCLDAYSGRFFYSHPEVIDKAENALNFRLLDEMYIPLNDLYYELGLRPVKMGDILGWDINNGKIDLEKTSGLDDDNIPYLVIDFDISPRYRYGSLH